MFCEINVKLVIFAVNIQNPINSMVLLYRPNSGKKMSLPPISLQTDCPIISTLHQQINEIFGTSGKWLELTPKQIGTFELLDNGLSFEILYTLFLPEKIKPLDENCFVWKYIDELPKVDLVVNTEEFIRFAALDGGNYVL